MKSNISETLDVPEGVHVTLNHGVFHVKGPKGELKRELHTPRILAKVEGNKIHFTSSNSTQREKKMTMTFAAHLRSAFAGVTHGHVYKLKVCSSHFPMTAALKGTNLEVKNYFGEQVARLTSIPAGVHCKVDAQIITLEGIDKELVSQTAARIELSTKRPGFDKRIFQDGIYITEKDGEAVQQ